MANISHFTQTVNGVSTTYDIHDANAVDLTNNQTVAGNKEFTGTTTAHDLVPSATDTYNLGTSTNKWKSFNGINPGALSLPNSSGTIINCSSYISDLTGGENNIPSGVVIDGWLYISAKGCTQLFVNSGFGYVRLQGSENLSKSILIPTVKRKKITVVVTASEVQTANIVPCQGNV